MDAKLEIPAEVWDELCWYGALNQRAAKVLNACEQAVKNSDGDVVYRDARGLARALSGNTADALEDFRFVVAESLNEAEGDEVLQRVRWIDGLERGENPFTEAELDSLR